MHMIPSLWSKSSQLQTIVMKDSIEQLTKPKMHIENSENETLDNKEECSNIWIHIFQFQHVSNIQCCPLFIPVLIMSIKVHTEISSTLQMSPFLNAEIYLTSSCFCFIIIGTKKHLDSLSTSQSSNCCSLALLSIAFVTRSYNDSTLCADLFCTYWLNLWSRWEGY